MKLLSFILTGFLLAVLSSALLAVQPRALQRDENYDESLPLNAKLKAEWVFARYHYDSGAEFGFGRGFQRWAADYPKSDRQFIEAVQRLTRVDTRTIEQVVDANSDDIYQLALDVSSKTPAAGDVRSASRAVAPIPPARRFHHARRYPRRLRMAESSGRNPDDISRRAIEEWPTRTSYSTSSTTWTRDFKSRNPIHLGRPPLHARQ